MTLKPNILAGISMPSMKTTMQYLCVLISISFTLGNNLPAQENYFENIMTTPATCGENNGTITMDSPPHYIEYEWTDGVSDLNRNALSPGKYIIEGVDEEGCKERVLVEIMDVADCAFELVTWQVPIIIISGSGEEEGIKTGLRPCLFVGFNFTLNGEVVPNEYLRIRWTITRPISYPPYRITTYSRAPTVPVYNANTVVNVEVSLIREGLLIPCCSFTDKITINEPCPTISTPEIFVSKSTFRDDANTKNIPGLVELIVYGDGSCGGTTDIRGFILDDNNGELVPPENLDLTTGQFLNVDPGYIRFSDAPNWAAVPNGSILTIYESGHDLNIPVASLNDPTDANQDFHYILPLEDTQYFEAYTSQWNVAEQMNTYDGEATLLAWPLIEADGRADAMQVRYPNGDYCHGVSYGKTSASTLENYFPLHISDTAYPYCQIQMQAFSYLDKTAFNLLELTGGFTPGAYTNEAISNVLGHLRDCNNIPLPMIKPEEGNPARLEEDLVLSMPEQEPEQGGLPTLALYPNPFHHDLQIAFQSKVVGTGNIRIYDSRGKLIKYIEVDCSTTLQYININLGDHNSSGLYLIQFRSPDAPFISKKAMLIKTD